MRNGRGEGTKIEKNFVFFVFLFFLFFFCKNMKKTCTRENTPNKNETYPVINERFATGASPLVILCSKRRDNDKKTDLKIEGGGKHAKKEKRRGMRNGCVFERGEKLKELFTFVVNCTSMDDPMKENMAANRMSGGCSISFGFITKFV